MELLKNPHWNNTVQEYIFQKELVHLIFPSKKNWFTDKEDKERKTVMEQGEQETHCYLQVVGHIEHCCQRRITHSFQARHLFLFFQTRSAYNQLPSDQCEWTLCQWQPIMISLAEIVPNMNSHKDDSQDKQPYSYRRCSMGQGNWAIAFEIYVYQNKTLAGKC